MHAHAQHTRLLASSIYSNPVHEHMLMAVYMPGHADRPIRLFRYELDTGKQSILAAKQGDLSIISAHDSSSFSRPPRRQEPEGPESMGLYDAVSDRPRSSKRQPIAVVQSLSEVRHYNYECSAPRPLPHSPERNDQPFAKKGDRRRPKAVPEPQ